MALTPMDNKGIDLAATALKSGKLVAFATETVYGLGGDASNDFSVANIFKVKGRPYFNPLILHLPDLETAWQYAVPNLAAHKLAEKFWPGPLTLVMPIRQKTNMLNGSADTEQNTGHNLSKLVSAGLDTIAIRIPNHPMTLALLEQTGLPIVAPSANKSGTLSPTTAKHVHDSLGSKLDMILDGGTSLIGLESTIIDVSGEKPRLLRPGGIAKETIDAYLGMPIDTISRSVPSPTNLDGPKSRHKTENFIAPKSPGLLHRHYAPQTPLRLNAQDKEPGEVYLGFGGNGEMADLNLSPTGNLVEAAAHLFRYLHQLDTKRAKKIAVAPIPFEGLGLAINDRLMRAATPHKHPFQSTISDAES